jgi:hypothetical protein
MLNFGIDFRHAVEFSRIGRTPRFRLSFEAPGQPAKHYCFVRGQSNRPLSSQSPCASQRPKPARGVIRLLGPSGSSERPAASASRTRSNKKNITDILGADANRGPRPRCSLLRAPCPAPPVTGVHPRHMDIHPRHVVLHLTGTPTTPLPQSARLPVRRSWSGRRSPLSHPQEPHRPADASRRVAARSGKV